MAQSEDTIERVIGWAYANSAASLSPQREALEITNAALRENQAQIDEILMTISKGEAKGGAFRAS